MAAMIEAMISFFFMMVLVFVARNVRAFHECSAVTNPSFGAKRRISPRK
jgi:hypothetical protein